MRVSASLAAVYLHFLQFFYLQVTSRCIFPSFRRLILCTPSLFVAVLFWPDGPAFGPLTYTPTLVWNKAWTSGEGCKEGKKTQNKQGQKPMPAHRLIINPCRFRDCPFFGNRKAL
jgi:hypothetical protein